MNINPYYGVLAGGGGGGSAAPHFAGFPFAQCGPDVGFSNGGSEFYAKQYHHHHHHQQNGAVQQLLKHHPASAAPASVANGNNNNNNNNHGGAVDATSSAYGGRECNGKLPPAGYGDAMHAMHVGSPIPGYGPASYGDHAGTYRQGGDDQAAMTPSPQRPSHQGMPPLAAARGQWSPSTSGIGVPGLGGAVKGDTAPSSDPYKLSPETAHHTAPSTPTRGPSAPAYDGVDAVTAPMSSPPAASATLQLQQQTPQQHQQYSSSAVHQPTIPYYPWMGVVGT